MPSIPPVEVDNFLDAAGECELGPDVLDMMDHKYDYTTTQKEWWHNRVERYLYSEHWRPYLVRSQ